MNTLEFFQTVLPDDGINYLVLFSAKLKDKRGNPIKLHKPYSDLESMALAAAEFDGNPEYLGVYHACGGYQRPYIELDELNDWGKPKRKYRVEENWHRAKSFWADIDCGRDKFDKGEGYLTQRDGAAAIFAAADKIGWPRPMLVNSGNGVHAYWPLEKTISHATWLKVAAAFKAALGHLQVKADPTRTADFASILRPPGTTNRKGEAKTVKVVRTCEPCDPKALADALSKYITDNDVKPQRSTKPKQNLNSDLTGLLGEFPQVDSSGELVASHCHQMAHLRDTKGDASFNTWRLLIGVLHHCVDGEKLAEEWTSERLATGHDTDDWHTRFHTWSAGPSRCDAIEAENSLLCKGCPHKGKITSPIQLGRIIPITEEKVVEIVNDDDKPEQATIPKLPVGYDYKDGLMIRVMVDKDGIPQPHAFCRDMFYPTTRIRGEDGTYRFGMRVHLHNHRVRDFQMNADAMASQTDLLRSLARYEVIQTNHKDAGNHLTAYLRDSIERLKREVDEINTLTSFGWKYDMTAFLCGDRLYHKDGTVRRVLLGGYAANKADIFPPVKGTVESYAKAMNYIYNNAEMRPLQYAILASWGSILSPFCEDTYNGLVFSMYGGTAVGKSTAVFNAMYAFGDAVKMTLKSDRGFTELALWARLGCMNNLPVLLDEATNIEPAALSRIAYTVSQGEERERLKATPNGTRFAEAARWRLNLSMTTNTDLHAHLSTHIANAEAEGVRVVQLNMNSYKLPQYEGPAKQAFIMACDQIKRNAGAAGEAMIKYCVGNVDAIHDRMRQKVLALAGHIPENKFRFYVSHAACCLVMGEIAKELGIVDWDMGALEDFAVQNMKELGVNLANSNVTTSTDAFGRMMADLNSRILVTAEYRDGRHQAGPESARRNIVGTVCGRLVLGSKADTRHAGRLWLLNKEVRDWCTKNRVDPSTLVKYLADKGALISEKERVNITRGTDSAPVQANCIEIDTTKLDLDIGPVVNSEEPRPVQAAGGQL